MIGDFLAYWHAKGFLMFVRIFWFFIFFEFTRYILVEYIVMIYYTFKRKIAQRRWELARSAFWVERPLVSVVIPGRNEGQHLYKLVRSLSEQTYQNIEIIVVDDGSDDQTPIIGNGLMKAGLIDLFLRNDVRGGKASAANLAWRFSKGKFIVHLDADCSFHYTAIENALVPFYLDEKIGGVGGSLEVRDGFKNLCTTLQKIEYLKTISLGRIVTNSMGIYPIISGAFGAFRADVIGVIKGWDIGPGLDGDLTTKIRKAGYKVHFEPDAIGLTSVPDNFIKLANQRLRWNKSVIRFRVRKHASVFFANEHFSFINMIASMESIMYSVVFNMLWYFNLIDQILHFPDQLMFIWPMSILLYMMANYVRFVLVLILSHEDFKDRVKLLPFLPLMVLYNGFYMRIIRTVAHLSELFFWSSYNDEWNPQKTSRHAKKMKL
jgi:cellulose synthase/poly-beta-1,6-N-acetylglucosamine synthase-like glycosyltransferase